MGDSLLDVMLDEVEICKSDGGHTLIFEDLNPDMDTEPLVEELKEYGIEGSSRVNMITGYMEFTLEW